MRLNSEQLDTFVEQQLSAWPLAKKNHDALADVEARRFDIGDLPVLVLHNPARIVSTGAKTDSESIGKRPCFLCAANRPEEQVGIDILKGWELLVNPYPIFPLHFTIASVDHTPQSAIPYEAASFAEMMPGMAVFFNGARAGASAPDHMHLQAVLKSELPLLEIAERYHLSENSPVMHSSQFGLDLPYSFYSAVITPDSMGMKTLAAICSVKGQDKKTGSEDSGLVNAFFWTDTTGMLRAVVVPRGAHRPSVYGEMTISPGAIDMAGVMIVPRKEDFERLDTETIKKIYSDVAIS